MELIVAGLMLSKLMSQYRTKIKIINLRLTFIKKPSFQKFTDFRKIDSLSWFGY